MTQTKRGPKNSTMPLVLSVFVEGVSMSAEEVCRRLPNTCSKATRTNLRKLTEAGQLVRSGDPRSYRYTLPVKGGDNPFDWKNFRQWKPK